MPTSAILTNASRLAIQNAFERIVKTHIPHGRWLGVNNYYSRLTVNRMDRETPATLKKLQVGEYIASSVVVHCADGWSYISRAVESLLNGDIPSAIHFAYYSELRSAMSLMGYEGIGIFNRRHVYFDGGQNPNLFNGFTTHSAADKGMKEWSNLPSKKGVVFDILRAGNFNFSDWVAATGFGSRSKYSLAVVNRWLKSWSIDLHLYDDQQLRNEMSYRPHFNRSLVDSRDTVDRISRIWTLLEPTDANRFPILDQYLLRSALEEVFRRSTGAAPVGQSYEDFLKKVFNYLGEDTSQHLYKFLLRRVEPDDAIIFQEAKKDRGNLEINKKDPFPILCRAILLLRISTGAAQNLIKNSSLKTDDLRYWWESLSLQNGYISTTPSGIETVDLYADIRDSLEEISNASSAYSTVKDAFTNLGQPMTYLKQFQRTAIWGMGL